MKRKSLPVVVLLGLLICYSPQPILSRSSSPVLSEVRKLFFQAARDKKQTVTLIALLKLENEPLPPVLLGYMGAATAMDAENYLMPYRKYKLFTDGKEMLEEAIRTSPDNAELRFLRFQIQVHTPALLGYQDQIEQDKEEVMKYLNLQHNNMTDDPDFLRKMVDAMKKSGKLTDEEKKLLMTLYN